MEWVDPLFIDTWGWLQVLSSRESRHEEVVRYLDSFLRQDGQAYTTDYVLDETLTLLFGRLSFQRAYSQYEVIAEAREESFLEVEWIGRDRFEAAVQLRQKYDDKPSISFTDLTSMVVMDEVGLRDVLTGDDHFRHVGMGFQPRP